MTDSAPAGAGAGEQSPLLPGDAKTPGGEGPEVARSVSWVLVSFLILGEIAGQGVFALPLHLGRLGWL